MLRLKSQITANLSEERREIKNEIQSHKAIKLKMIDTWRLLFLRACVCCKNRMTDKNFKLLKLFEWSKKKIEKSLSVTNLISDLRDIKILLKGSLMTKEIEKSIAHAHVNVIDLDGDYEYSLSSC